MQYKINNGLFGIGPYIYTIHHPHPHIHTRIQTYLYSLLGGIWPNNRWLIHIFTFFEMIKRVFRYFALSHPLFFILCKYLQIHNSTDNVVVLKSVNLSSTGRYRCEVSAEAPSFETVSDHGDMIVVGKFSFSFHLYSYFDQKNPKQKQT